MEVKKLGSRTIKVREEVKFSEKKEDKSKGASEHNKMMQMEAR
jgi:hypothetical protein